LRGQRFDVARDRDGGALVAFFDGQIEQIARFGQALGQAADAADDTLQARTFLAEFLRTLRIVPDVRIFEFTGDFFEPLGLGLEVKDTP